MIDTRVAVRSQLIPIDGDSLLLPNTAIAEVIYYQQPAVAEGAPDWLLGHLIWREMTVALISFEHAMHADITVAGIGGGHQVMSMPSPRSKVVVVNTLSGNAELGFFSILAQGMPKLLLVDETKIVPIEHETEMSPLVLSRVIVNGEPAIIPNLDALEEMLLACKNTWAQKEAMHKS